MASKFSEEIKEIRQFLYNYKPGRTVKRYGSVRFPDTLCIGLFGRTGCGKTSLINSLKYATEGKLRKAMWLHVAGQEKGGGHTMYRKRVELTEHIAVIDNRGMDRMHATTAMEELIAQLAGTRGYTEVVTWEKSIRDPAQQLGDKIASVVLVLSALHNIEETMNGLADFISVIHTTQGQYPVAVITSVDQANQDAVEELKVALRAEGLSDSCIFTVVNVTDFNPRLHEAYQLNLLKLIYRCILDGDQAIIFQHNEQYEGANKRQMGEMEAHLRGELKQKALMEQLKLSSLQNAMGNMAVQNLGQHAGHYEKQITDELEPAVTDAHILKLSKLLHPNLFYELHVALDIDFSSAERIREKSSDRKINYIQLLQEWKAKALRTVKDLDSILKKIDAGGLVGKY